MKINSIFTIVILLFFSISISSQNNNKLSIGFESNAQYYLDDDVTGDFTEDDNFRSNNYLKLDYGITDFTFGLQFEGYAPQSLLNYSPKYDEQFNIATYFAKYSQKKWDLTLGYFYEQFGSGLILRSWEDRQLGINNAIRGGKLSFRPTEKISMTAFYGNQRNGFKVSDGSLFGFDSNFDLSSENNSLQFGLSYVGRDQDTDFTNTELDNITHAFSGRLNYAKNNIYANIEGVLKSKDALVENGIVSTDKVFYGNALLLELGYSKKGLGITTSLRRLENMNFYADREAGGNPFNEQIVNFIPGLTKQHDYSLSNIYVYQAQSGISFDESKPKVGEIGMQWDLFYKIKKGTKLGGKYGAKLAVNFSNWYGLGAKFNTFNKRLEVDFIDLGERYYTDINFEVRKKFSKKTNMIFTYINTFYNKRYIEETSGKVNANIAAVELTQKFGNKKSIRSELQHLWTKDDKQNWLAATTEFNINTHFSIFGTDMYNYGNDHTEDRNHYYNFGGSYSKNRSRFSLGYGRQRGGLLCVGGVCRVVSPATGFTFSINTSF